MKYVWLLEMAGEAWIVLGIFRSRLASLRALHPMDKSKAYTISKVRLNAAGKNFNRDYHEHYGTDRALTLVFDSKGKERTYTGRTLAWINKKGRDLPDRYLDKKDWRK